MIMRVIVFVTMRLKNYIMNYNNKEIKLRLVLTIFLSLFVLSLNAEECEVSNWGSDDEIGNANLITPNSILKASKLIKTGKVYGLGLIIDANTPAYPPRSLSLQVVQPNQQFGNQASPNSTYNDDIFQGWFGIGSQLDGLGHLGGPDGTFYNCNKGKDFAQIDGLTKLGIETVPPIVARGIILDMANHFGVEYLEAGRSFSVEDVKAVEKKQGTPIKKGDVVIFHTGWIDAKFESDPNVWGSAEPGQSPEVAEYLASKDVVAVGADNWGLDVIPPKDMDKAFQGHVILLKENGIFILEAMNTGPLVKDNALEFLFVLGHAKVRGAVQMIINPIAIN